MAVTPWLLLDMAPVPGEDEKLHLYQRGDEYSIRLEKGGELMNTRIHGSEDALAELTCARLTDLSLPRLLIGGLGIGFTLAAALRRLGPDAVVEVAELVPAVVEWNRELLGGHAGLPLEDPRTRVHLGDVARLLGTQRQVYDAVLLDVDNGPEGLTRRRNDWLYSVDGLSTIYGALRRGGVLAVWSAGPERSFSDRLRKVGFQVEEVSVRAYPTRKRPRHTIWLACRQP